MPPDVLETLLRDGPVPFAVKAQDGTLTLVSRRFAEVTGLDVGRPAPEWPSQVQLGESLFEIWTCGPVVGLREVTDSVRMEDQIWELQARLSKVYSELSVRNQALVERETDLQSVNRGLEDKVKEQLQLLERSNRLMRYLSPEVAKSVLKSEGVDLSPRKRQLTFFFADLSSFDELVAEMESEEVIEILNDYRREMAEVLFAHGGTLDKFITARVAAFFGDPVPQEDPVTRAVRTALDMRERIGGLRRKWFPSATHVDLQAAIHLGYATVGNVGSEHRVDYTVIGKNVALTAALQQEAAPGHILLTARAHEAVKDLFDFEELQVALKGSSRPIQAYRARGMKAAPAQVAETTEVLEAARIAGVGKRIAHFSVVRKIGQGGMGTVYEATDERLQRRVALKVLSGDLASDPKFVARFKHEAQALASLNSPYVAQIYFVSDTESPPFFAMELIEGTTLQRVLVEQGRLPLRRSLELTVQIARGLQAAAEKGIVHRDMKPDNVMLTTRGQAKLTDFGLVKSLDRDPGLTSQWSVMGTPLYMSPEQARGEEVDFRTDIYSLGATLFHMLTGQPPFRGESVMVVLRKHEQEELPPLSTLPPSFSPTVYQLLSRMMAKRREQRFDSYERLLEALENC